MSRFLKKSLQNLAKESQILVLAILEGKDFTSKQCAAQLNLKMQSFILLD